MNIIVLPDFIVLILDRIISLRPQCSNKHALINRKMDNALKLPVYKRSVNMSDKG